MTRNAEVAALFEEYADLVEAQDVQYKPQAYRRAADNIRDYPEDIEELAAEGPDAVGQIPQVGDSIASKVIEYFETGEIEELEEERANLPVEMAELTRVEGVGPKTVGDLYHELGVQTLDDLEDAARKGKIQEIKGYGPKSEQNILDGIEFARTVRGRELLGDARPVGEQVLAFFDEIPTVGRHELAGSLRRWRETIGDIDVLAESEEKEAVIDAFTDWGRATEVIEAGTDKAAVRVSDMRIDLRVVVPEEFGSALQYFTGSKNHNITLRNYAIEQGYKVNEYGVFDVSDVENPDAGQRVGERVAGETEASMYDALGLPLIPPEMREDNGEIDAALAGDLPDLIEEGDVRGDLHLHTNWSDGNDTIAEMVEGAADFGHDYIAISDHATGSGMVGGVGLDDEELEAQIDEVRAVAEDAAIDVFTGVEANIDPDGGISVGDDVLADLDIVVASPHSGLDGDGTDRLIRAIEHPSVDILGHPSGRLINRRPGHDFDVRAVARAAADNGVALEINSNPHRLDLWGAAVQVAVEEGATIAIDTDAHSPAEYRNVRYGVHTARRGWAEAADVLNARDAAGVRGFLH
ncbi:PHP domain protein [Haladaptatus paucihalophilus DX253]|uniref:DNA polymerase beta n=1 Tax=Haladaptatus paucihalophilus DX253 TaxID=797209 RepID=E7QRK7_HALPU|nr:DNA polymerase/3'-5' exonuclease PolX [Haladaptatus paucihalophilus]EFW92626.1 PHP domain protein [Haladaptatus paucihalophilus DX253]SHK17299.1 DNA polymerase (family 10) [Haladaptatus paucihalophilus DX253]